MTKATSPMSRMMCTAPSSFTSVPSGISSRVFTEMSSFFFTPVINSMSCSPLFLACPGLLFQIKKSRNSFLTTVPDGIFYVPAVPPALRFSLRFSEGTPTHLYLTRITDLLLDFLFGSHVQQTGSGMFPIVCFLHADALSR